MNRIIALSIGLFVAFFACADGWAQATAQISGTVKDQSGAVLPGVVVNSEQTATGAKRSSLTDESGLYVLTNLPVGLYTLEFALPGFATYVQTGIVLQVGGNLAVNAVLTIGQLADTISVQADAALVETRNTGVGQTIDNQRVLELPLNGRNAVELLFLTGAATEAPSSQLNTGIRNYPTVAVSIAGGMNNGVEYLLDGGTHNDPQNSLNLPLPFPDALQEFKLETSGLGAQYGHHASGVINAVTKSGGNAFHGDIFEFVRNGSMNARNTFAVANDGLKRNQFGGTIGGPIVKDKLFFFAGEQTTIQRTSPSDIRAYVPTPDMLGGDFTTVTSPLCNVSGQINLPAPFVNNKISPSSFSQPALNLLKRIPAATDACGLIRYGGKLTLSEHLLVGKVDYQLSDKQSLFVRYIGGLRNPSWDYDGSNPLTFTYGKVTQRAHSLVLGHTYLFGNGTVSSFHLTGLRTANPRVVPEIFNFSDIGIASLYEPFKGYLRLTVNNAFTSAGLPQGVFATTGGSNNSTPGYYNTTGAQFSEDISHVQGPHQLGFGVNYIHANFNGLSNPSTAPQFTFAGTRLTGMGVADYLLGLPSSFSQAAAAPVMSRSNYFGAYIQDTWKMTSNWTWNFGVRYEPFISAYDQRDRTNRFSYESFNSGFRSTVYPKAPVGINFSGDPGRPESAYSFSRLLHFAPRVGFAYDPTGRGSSTIRAAYGLFYDLPHLWTYWGVATNNPWSQSFSIPNPNFENPWATYPGGNPFPATFSKDSTFPQFGAYFNLAPDPQPTYMHQWNLNVQKQFGTDWLVSGNYLGNTTVHVWGPVVQLNPGVYMPGASCVIQGTTYTPCTTTGNLNQRRVLYLQDKTEGQYYGAIGELQDQGTSNYEGLLLSVQRRRSQKLTIQGNYTYSHCIGDQAAGQPSSGGVLADRRWYERGNCTGDIRQMANASAVVETPRLNNGVLGALAGGWQVSGLIRIQSGSPLTVVSGLDTSYTGTNGGNRASQLLEDPYLPNKGINGWLNPAAFVRPANGVWGDSGALTIAGPGSVRVDMGLTRKFQVREGQAIEFRAEAFNLANHVNPTNPITDLSSQTFGKFITAADPRILQLALKYAF